MENKTLFDAVEAELRNARAAINNAGGYLDILKEAMDSMVKISGTDLMVKTKEGEYGIPIAVHQVDELKERPKLL